MKKDVDKKIELLVSDYIDTKIGTFHVTLPPFVQKTTNVFH